MGSLIDELQRRGAAAREEAEGLRGQIALLAERLAGVEERLSRLVIARETVDEVLSEAGPGASSAVVPDGAVASRSGHLSAVGVLVVPPWRAGLEAFALPGAYRDLLEVLEDAGRPLRAVQIAAAGGLSTDKAKVEGLRSKLKRPRAPAALPRHSAGPVHARGLTHQSPETSRTPFNSRS